MEQINPELHDKQSIEEQLKDFLRHEIQSHQLNEGKLWEDSIDNLLNSLSDVVMRSFEWEDHDIDVKWDLLTNELHNEIIDLELEKLWMKLDRTLLDEAIKRWVQKYRAILKETANDNKKYRSVHVSKTMLSNAWSFYEDLWMSFVSRRLSYIQTNW